MYRRLVVRVVINAFNDVDFTTSWPVGSISPEGRPNTTPSGNMNGVHDDQPSGERGLGGNANALACIGNARGCFDSHDSIAVRINTQNPTCSTSGLVDILNDAVGRI